MGKAIYSKADLLYLIINYVRTSIKEYREQENEEVEQIVENEEEE